MVCDLYGWIFITILSIMLFMSAILCLRFWVSLRNDVWFFGVIFLLLLLALPFAQFPVLISDNRSGSHCIFNILSLLLS